MKFIHFELATLLKNMAFHQFSGGSLEGSPPSTFNHPRRPAEPQRRDRRNICSHIFHSLGVGNRNTISLKIAIFQWK